MLCSLLVAMLLPGRLPTGSNAQGADTTYWDSNWHRVLRPNAVYYGWTVPLDSGRCRILDFYITGERQMEAIGRCGATIVKDGVAIYYYRSGVKSAAGQFRNGKREGQWSYWREDGSIRLQRQWHTGLAQSARDSVADPDSRIPQIVMQMPKFLGGTSVNTYLAHIIQRPPGALPGNSQEGKVFVQFVVGPLGNVTSARIVKGFAPDYDAAVLRAVVQLPRWQPGQENGKAVPVRMIVPVTFH